MITVIIPNRNGKLFLKKCLASIPKGIPVTVVDNASTDGTQNLAQIKNKKNLGFAKAVNQGLKLVKTKYVLILNNDVILDKNFFANFKKVQSEHQNFFCYCPTVLDIKAQIENTGLIFYLSGKAVLRKNNTSAPVWGAPATACVYKTSDLKKLNSFDDSFFAYIEDVDLHYRANKLNLKTYHSSSLICTHYGGGTAGKHSFFRARHTFLNWIYFICKNYTKKQILSNLFAIILERARNFKYLLFCLINKYV